MARFIFADPAAVPQLAVPGTQSWSVRTGHLERGPCFEHHTSAGKVGVRLLVLQDVWADTLAGR